MTNVTCNCFRRCKHLGARFIIGLLDRNISVTAISRSPLNPEVMSALNSSTTASSHQLVSEYTNTVLEGNYEYIFFTSGFFMFSNLTSLTDEDIRISMSENIVSPIILTKRLLQEPSLNFNKTTNFIYIGSTSAYEGFAKTGVYCAAKFAFRGFVKSMNSEYASTGVRFWLASMGTVNTRMGRLFANSIGRKLETLLDPNRIALRVLASVLESSDSYEPEMMFRIR